MDFVAKLPCKLLYFGGIFFSERDSLIPLGTPLLALLFLRIVHCVSQGDGVESDNDFNERFIGMA